MPPQLTEQPQCQRNSNLVTQCCNNCGHLWSRTLVIDCIAPLPASYLFYSVLEIIHKGSPFKYLSKLGEMLRFIAKRFKAEQSNLLSLTRTIVLFSVQFHSKMSCWRNSLDLAHPTQMILFVTNNKCIIFNYFYYISNSLLNSVGLWAIFDLAISHLFAFGQVFEYFATLHRCGAAAYTSAVT